MGIKNLSTPYVRDHSSAKNKKLKDVIEATTEDVIIGFDISIVIIKLMSTNPALISQYHCQPEIPLFQLGEAVVDYLKPYFTAGMKKAVLTFDGLTKQVKRERAHQDRDAGNKDKANELKKLLKVTAFSSDTEEKEAVARVRKLRTSLSPIRQDMLYEIKVKVAKAFGDKVSCVGSPYEADQHLASLYNQGVVDYVVTTDSDLICLGSTVIIDMNKHTSECWIMSAFQLLSDRLPEKFGTEGVLWTATILHHVGCFLGNDYIKRVPGNGPSRMKTFVEALSPLVEADDEDGITQCIYNNALSAPKGNKTQKQDWESVAKSDGHFKLWTQAKNMFTHGPAFIIASNDLTQSVRSAFFDGEYAIKLGSVSDSSIQWTTIDDVNKKLFGFDPYGDLIDKLDVATPSAAYSNDEERRNALMHECFTLHRWSKTGVELKPLSPPKDDDGNELYFGSIVDFDKIPVCHHSIDTLKFWLDTIDRSNVQTSSQIFVSLLARSG